MNSMCIVTIFDFFRGRTLQQKKALPAGKRRAQGRSGLPHSRPLGSRGTLWHHNRILLHCGT